MGTAVSNSTCLIALEKIGRMDILRAGFDEVLIPPEVQDEFGVRETIHRLHR